MWRNSESNLGLNFLINLSRSEILYFTEKLKLKWHLGSANTFLSNFLIFSHILSVLSWIIFRAKSWLPLYKFTVYIIQRLLFNHNFLSYFSSKFNKKALFSSRWKWRKYFVFRGGRKIPEITTKVARKFGRLRSIFWPIDILI